MKGAPLSALMPILASSLRLGRLDPGVLILCLSIATIGLVILNSASEGNDGLVLRQASRLAIGFLALWVCAQIPPSWLERFAPHLYLLSLFPLVLVLLVGEGRGAERWLDLGLLRFQPSELAKFTVPLACAWLLARAGIPPGWGALLGCFAMILPPVLMIQLQPDLGTAILVGLAGLAVVFLAGLSWRRILLLAALGLAAIPASWPFLHEYQKMRIRTLFAPDADPLGHGWNTIQALTAVGSGGLTGKGFGQGTQAHLAFLPEHTTDFAFAVLAEEFGFVGVALSLLLYFALGLRILWLAMGAPSPFGRLLVGALGVSFLLHVSVNAAMVAGLIPVVGVPMPLLSYGGTIAVTMMASFGVAMSLSVRARRPRVP
ncbi:MAG: rod shape-determining protein RodA [Lysobacterales bacterium]|jgi:rod shape determining protein RodA|nr:MAG: rod shape-determining protein RodA [Xanthomonadales bacterium]